MALYYLLIKYDEENRSPLIKAETPQYEGGGISDLDKKDP